MNRLYLTFAVCLFTLSLFGQAGGPALAYAEQDAPTGILAFKSATTPTAPATSKTFTLRRERTLLGDLDLSGAWGGPTYNYSATGDDWSLVRGGFGGLEFGEDVFIGYGGWSSREPFTTDEAPSSGSRPQYDFRHGGFIIGVAPGADNVIHPRLTAIVGPGRIDYRTSTGLAERERMLVGQLMGGAEINLFQWFRLGIEGGYRFASGVDIDDVPISGSDVSGAVFQIEARFGWSW
jgi:hypothetical protein